MRGNNQLESLLVETLVFFFQDGDVVVTVGAHLSLRRRLDSDDAIQTSWEMPLEKCILFTCRTN